MCIRFVMIVSILPLDGLFYGKVKRSMLNKRQGFSPKQSNLTSRQSKLSKLLFNEEFCSQYEWECGPHSFAKANLLLDEMVYRGAHNVHVVHCSHLRNNSFSIIDFVWHLLVVSYRLCQVIKLLGELFFALFHK